MDRRWLNITAIALQILLVIFLTPSLADKIDPAVAQKMEPAAAVKMEPSASDKAEPAVPDKTEPAAAGKAEFAAPDKTEITAADKAESVATDKSILTVHTPPLIDSIRNIPALSFCGEPVPLDRPDLRERMEKEMLLSLGNRPQVILWLKRAGRYFPHIEKMLAENDMPDDLKYVAIVESALRPHAGSHKGAIGYWQFIRSTGLKYGLTINAKKDERRNFFASTQAALAYFKVLYSLFESWTMAAAAYNMGEQGLQAAMEAQQTNNYYELYLSLETQRYLFRILAVKLILSHPQQYGFALEKKDLYTPLTFDLITLKCERIMPIRLVAEASNTYFKKIKDLNPEFRGYALAKGIHDLRIPKGQAMGFLARFKTVKDQWLAQKNEKIYVVQKGDHLTAIATRFNVPLKSLLSWNQLNWRKPIHPGDRLIIYPEKN